MAEFNRKYKFVDNLFIKKLFKGLSEDLQLLYLNFYHLKDKSFQSFASLWVKMKFASIFGEKYIAAEILEYTQGVLHFLKGYLFSTEIVAVTFGVYAVYAVYNKQPLQGKISKLRLTNDEFSDLRERFKLLMKEEYNDAAQLIVYMFRNSYFKYVATPLDSGIGMGHRKYFAGNVHQDIGHERTTDPFDRNLLDSFETLKQLYTEKKKVAFANGDAFGSDSDFLSLLREKLSHFGRDVPKIPQIIEKEPLDTGTSDHGLARRRLKQRSFAQNAVPSTSASPERPKKTRTSRKKLIKMEIKSEDDLEEDESDKHETEYFDLDIFD